MQTASEHFEAGRLTQAIEAMNAEVRGHPRDANRRGFLGELLCLAGNLERADLQYDAIAAQDQALALGTALIRQLISGEQARREFFLSGRVPEMFGAPPEHMRLTLEASIRLREGAIAEAAGLLARAEEARPQVAVTHDGAAFDDFRDLDDLTASFFEVVTSTGKYYLVPFERIASVEFFAPERPRDLMWRRAQMSVIDGPEGEVFIPVAYLPPAGYPAASVTDAARLGRTTDWVGGDGAPTRGIGQRSYLLGEDSIGILELHHLEFSAKRG